MPQYLAPDVYVEEVDSGNQPIEGVSTSITGFVGMTQRGPSTGLPQLVTSFSEFQRKYGSYFDFGPTFAGHSSLPFAVDGFFTNLGKLLYISRVLPPGATKATVTTQGGLVTRLAQDTSIAVALQKQVRPATLARVELFDIFRGKNVPDGQKSMAYAFTYRHAERTLTDVEVNAAHEKLVEQFKSSLGAVIRL